MTEVIRVYQMIGGGIMVQVAVTDWLFTFKFLTLRQSCHNQISEGNLISFIKDMLLMHVLGNLGLQEYSKRKDSPTYHFTKLDDFFRVQAFTQDLATPLERKKFPNIQM